MHAGLDTWQRITPSHFHTQQSPYLSRHQLWKVQYYLKGFLGYWIGFEAEHPRISFTRRRIFIFNRPELQVLCPPTHRHLIATAKRLMCI
jgi:hypothetical protein